MKQLENNLTEIYRALLNREFLARQVGKSCHPEYELSAINLVRYLTLRSMDLRKVHDHLSELGISALRSSEGYVWSNVTAALRLVKLLNGEKWEPIDKPVHVGYKKSKKLVKKHTSTLFNLRNRSKLPRIMVTMPREAAEDSELIEGLLDKGMEIARINLSHDDQEIWSQMIKRIKDACTSNKKECKIYLDLSGPKVRTGSVSIKNNKKKSDIDYIRLYSGDHLVLNSNIQKAKDCIRGERGELVKAASIGVSLPSILEDIQIGDRILFDDGKIESKVISKRSGEVTAIINGAPEKGVKLRSQKGINLPDTHLNLPSLTNSDIEHLPFVCKHADIIGYSFVREASDVRMLHEKLAENGREDVGIVLKIENKVAFENLPLILFEAMKWPRVAVMIARGDLAVEIGPERIAEVQDQILWLCEAAHIPVIWATEVLDNLAKTGKATRAEVTDAAKSARAECVMLNKGPYVIKATEMLSNILQRMNNHTSKKKSIMRALKVAQLNIDKLANVIEEHAEV